MRRQISQGLNVIGQNFDNAVPGPGYQGTAGLWIQ